MYCVECGKEISDKSKFCPYCGAAIDDDGGNSSSDHFTQAPEQASWKEIHNLDQPKRTGNRKKVPILIGIIALVLIVGGFLVKRVFYSPEKMYASIEKENFSTASNAIKTNYTPYYNLTNGNGQNMTAEVTLKSGLQNLLQSMNMGDVSWLKSISLSAGSVLKDNHLLLTTTAKINNATLNLNGDMDMTSGKLYYQIPKIVNGWACTDLAALSGISQEDLQNQFKNAISNVQSSSLKPEDISSIFDRYTRIYLKHCNDVKLERGELQATNVSQKCNAYTVTLTGPELKDMLDDMLDNLKQDKDILKLFGDSEDSKTQYLTAIENAKNELDNYDSTKLNNSSITMTLYAKGKETIGRDMKVIIDGANYLTVTSAMPISDNKVGIKLHATSGDDTILNMTGTGTQNGNLLNLDNNMIVYVPDSEQKLSMKVKTENFNLDKANEKGEIDGTFTIIPDLSSVSPALGSSISVKTTCKTAADTSSLSLIPSYNGVELAKVDFNLNTSAPNLEPADTANAFSLNNETDAQLLLTKYVNYDEVKNFTLNIGLPQDYENAIVEQINQIAQYQQGQY